MKKQTLNLLSASVLLVLALTLVSATITLDQSVYNINKSESSFYFTVTSDSNTSEMANLSIDNSNFLFPNNLSHYSINLANSSQTITVDYNASTFTFSDYPTIDTYNLKLGGSNVALISFDRTYCLNGNQGRNIQLKVTDDTVDEEKTWKWRPFNNVALTVNVKNIAPGTDTDISGTMEWCLVDKNKTDEGCVFDGTESFSLSKGDDQDFDVKINLDPSKINFDSTDYIFYAKAYDDTDWSENTQCAEKSNNAIISLNSKEVIIDENKVVLPETVNAGDTVVMQVPVYNIGKSTSTSSSQKDIWLRLSSSGLGISNLNQSVGSISAGNSKVIDFSFKVPENAVAGKTYPLILEVYDKNGDIYQYRNNNGDKVDSSFAVNLKISGDSQQSTTSTQSATLSAELATSAKAGQDVVVNGVIANTGKSTATFNLNTLGYSAWADSVKISEDSVSLKAGESKDLTFTFKTKATASGTNKFTVEVLSGDNLVVSQPVSVEVEKSSSFSDLFQFGDNWYLWAIGAFNVILVVVIIIVVIRLLRK